MGQAQLPSAGTASAGEWIEVSPEMTAVIGAGMPPEAPLPPEPMLLAFDVSGAHPTLFAAPAYRAGEPLPGASLLLIVSRAAWEDLDGPALGSAARYHLITDLRAIALSLRDERSESGMRIVYRLAKSLELLCDTIAALRDDKLLPVTAEGALSFADTRRVIAARRMIDERWHEKLTLETIARACGLNRDKLTRGFREFYDCSIGEALAERRLGHASRMLLTTDKPVSSIGYENGYMSNASFARAFSRRFGVSPSDYRSYRMAS